ncbi:sugar kinase [Erysipelothrix urinaevulpis]|uniref:sugar kinase n=1 Tax=Erysipelothrix urinaevulpis TaxID=2683717 RepID=UPI00135AE4E7|nr:sugar kinase [Erysipelothrix urinaevulpis]
MKVLAFGEVMLRLEVLDHDLLQQSNQFKYSFVGTGLNVLSGLSSFGIETTLLTALPDNNLGKAALETIQKVGIDSRLIKTYGEHMGSYILEKGHGFRPSEVTYLDRSLSSFNTRKLTVLEIEEALQGVCAVHLCGIALTTSNTSRENCLRMIEVADKQDITIIFDCNVRPSLVKKQEIKNNYEQVLNYADIVFGSRYDAKNFLELDCDDEKLLKAFIEKYEIELFLGTHKNNHDYQGFIMSQDEYVLSSIYDIQDVLDPVGTGDAYAARAIAGILREESLQRIVDRASMSGVLSHSIQGDKCLVTEKMIEQGLSSNGSKIIR